jgi:hypothetical protein
MYAVTVALVMYALPRTRTRAAVLRLFVWAAFVFWVASVLLHTQKDFSKWLNAIVRDLSFGSAVVTLCAWFFFIRAEKRDSRLLMVTAGLGLQLTCDAMGESLLQVISAQRFNFLGGLVSVFGHLLCLLIWWYAFRGQSPGPAFGAAERLPRPGPTPGI